MTEAKLTWSIWQALLNAFAWAFTRRGFHHFAEWITAMALNVEEHTITQSVLALEQPATWKALESFAEYGSWHEDRVTWALTHLGVTRSRSRAKAIWPLPRSSSSAIGRSEPLASLLTSAGADLAGTWVRAFTACQMRLVVIRHFDAHDYHPSLVTRSDGF